MGSSSFKYKKIGTSPEVGHILRPIIPIQLQKKNVIIRQEVLLDTGADFCLFSGEVADLLDIELKTGTRHKVMGVGGAVTKGYIHKIGISIPGFGIYNAWAFFCDKSELNEAQQGILGQLGFFEKFRVSFEYSKRKIVIRN